MARPKRPARASRATRTATACATRCARKRKTRRSVKPAPRRPANAGSRRNSFSAPGFRGRRTGLAAGSSRRRTVRRNHRRCDGGERHSAARRDAHVAPRVRRRLDGRLGAAARLGHAGAARDPHHAVHQSPLHDVQRLAARAFRACAAALAPARRLSGRRQRLWADARALCRPSRRPGEARVFSRRLGPGVARLAARRARRHPDRQRRAGVVAAGVRRAARFHRHVGAFPARPGNGGRGSRRRHHGDRGARPAATPVGNRRGLDRYCCGNHRRTTENSMTIWITILGMALVTYLLRRVPAPAAGGRDPSPAAARAALCSGGSADRHLGARSAGGRRTAAGGRCRDCGGMAVAHDLRYYHRRPSRPASFRLFEMKRLSVVTLLLCAACAGGLAAAAEAPRKIASLEGVTEYLLPNGMRLLTLPDPGIDTATVHIVYLVGSRHEGYGEKGMAHLLEHLLFKGSGRHPNVKEEFTRRGARWNGTTSNDRTTYFETFAANDDNLAWAIEMEADRMVNSSVSRQDLDSEMSVVRNEFELGENNPGSVLFQRMQQAAYPWHNYGNPIIGMRSDIERVPIDRLQAFYRTWYQPDNALLIVAGRFDEARALELVGRHFGALPRPSRALPSFYTEEPTQDGERTVFLRRSGDNPIVSSMYRVPAGAHPEYPAIDVLTNILGDVPAGRLHRAIVQKGLASYVWGAERGLHDPGYVYFGARLDKSASLDRARDALIQEVENVRKERITVEEVERARTALLNEFEKSQLETGAFVRALSEFAATGSWRLFFLYRERLRKVTLDDVQRAAERYLKPANRVLGIFVPTDQPDRAEIPAATGLEEALTAYRGDDTKSLPLGEAFDPSPANIESRVSRRQLANGIRAALLPKKTRGGRVVVSLALHWGDEKSLHNREVACDFAGSMLLRGSKKHT